MFLNDYGTERAAKLDRLMSVVADLGERGQSWLNNFPVQRRNYPLLFDRDFEPKPALDAVVDPDYEP